MKTITPKSQNGFDLTVEFVLPDNSVRAEKISMRPYFTDEVRIVGRVDKEGNPILDKRGQQVMEEVAVQVWHNPAENLEEFLQSYRTALEAGIEAEKPPAIPPEFFNRSL